MSIFPSVCTQRNWKNARRKYEGRAQEKAAETLVSKCIRNPHEIHVILHAIDRRPALAGTLVDVVSDA